MDEVKIAAQLSCTVKIALKTSRERNKQRNKIVISRNIKNIFRTRQVCEGPRGGRRTGAIVKTHKFTKLAIIVHKTVSKSTKALNASIISSLFFLSILSELCVNSRFVVLWSSLEISKRSERNKKILIKSCSKCLHLKMS